MITTSERKSIKWDSRLRGNDGVCCERSLNNKSVIPAQAGIPFGSFLLTALLVLVTSVAHADTPKIDPKLCNALVKNTPDADVAYQPGVDVHGNAVAPADLPGSPQMKLPQQIKIPLTINMAKAANLDTSTYPFNQLGQGTEATLGMLVVEGDRVTFNGQPLSDTQQYNLAVLCMQPK